jgi:hypothetical protein
VKGAAVGTNFQVRAAAAPAYFSVWALLQRTSRRYLNADTNPKLKRRNHGRGPRASSMIGFLVSRQVGGKRRSPPEKHVSWPSFTEYDCLHRSTAEMVHKEATEFRTSTLNTRLQI